MPTLFLSMFMTDYLKISPVAMANGMLIARFVDFAVSLIPPAPRPNSRELMGRLGKVRPALAQGRG